MLGIAHSMLFINLMTASYQEIGLTVFLGITVTSNLLQKHKHINVQVIFVVLRLETKNLLVS